MVTKIAVIEDNEVYRQGLISFLPEQIEFVGWGEFGSDAYNMAKIADILFLDLIMPETTESQVLFDYNAFLKYTKSNHTDLRIVIVSSQLTNEILTTTLPLVAGYLYKQDGTKREIERAILTSSTSNLPYFSQTIEEALNRPPELLNRSPHPYDRFLDNQDQLILQKLFQHRNSPYKEIGDQLGFSESTIKRRISIINKNLGQDTLRGTLLELLKSKWIDLDDL